MRGGMKVYAGSPVAARQYLTAEWGRADDYYLTEGTGIAPGALQSGERL
jgi:exodeoxyribonuclease V alpha subunit